MSKNPPKLDLSSPNLGIAEEGRDRVTALLSILLADEVALYLKTRNFHWNVVGINFAQLHAFFEQQYEALDEIVDAVAERIRSLGARAPGSMKEFLAAARIAESDGAIAHATELIQTLLSDHESVIRGLREDLATVGASGDAGSEDFLTGLIEQHEKMAWMLRSHLQ